MSPEELINEYESVLQTQEWENVDALYHDQYDKIDACKINMFSK